MKTLSMSYLLALANRNALTFYDTWKFRSVVCRKCLTHPIYFN